MRRCFSSWLGFCLGMMMVGTLDAGERLFPPAQHGRGEFRYLDGVPVAIMVGSPAEIGAQHAALLAKPAAAMMQFPKRLVEAVGAKESWPLAVMASKQLLQHAPTRYQAELAAAAMNPDIDADTLGVGNTLLELRRLGCSTLIVEPPRSATGGPLMGRNFDFPPLGLLDQFSLVTIVRAEGKRPFAAVGYPGLMGVLSGMNDAGLAVATIDVYEAANGSPPFDPSGVPQMFVFRQILEECATVAEAEALLRRTKATTWSNLAVCDRERGAIFEITSTEVQRRDAQDSVLPCTNHFRSKALAMDTDCWRYRSLLTATQQEKLDVPAVHAHLHAANQGELTLHTIVFEPRELVMHVAFGRAPSSALPLKRMELRELLTPPVALAE